MSSLSHVHHGHRDSAGSTVSMMLAFIAVAIVAFALSFLINASPWTSDDPTPGQGGSDSQQIQEPAPER